MKKRMVIIIFSIFATSLFLPGDYGLWTDELNIIGNMVVVQSVQAPIIMPIPTPVLTTLPVPGEVVPVADGAGGTTPIDNTTPMEGEIPASPSTDAIEQDSIGATDEGPGEGIDQQGQTDTGETIVDDAIPEDGQSVVNDTEQQGEETEEPETTESETTESETTEPDVQIEDNSENEETDGASSISDKNDQAVPTVSDAPENNASE